jgi:hypothetical protein
VRHLFLGGALAVALATACTGPASSPSASTGAVTTSPLPALPPDLPPSFGDDVGPGDVPAAALIPLGAEVTASWSASTSSGDAIVVAWDVPEHDEFFVDRGIAAWRRFDDGGAPWRPVWGAAYPSNGRSPLANLTADVADLTGDGSPDALIHAETGGSGGCATDLVVDLATGTRIYRSQGCDRTVQPSSDPAGLTIREAVYHRGDAHCCPSAVRTTVLVDDGGTWRTASSSVADT